jgi:RNA polymerase sigma factor (sigma-70 family)
VGLQVAKVCRRGRVPPSLRSTSPQRLAVERLKATVDWADLIERVATKSDRDAFKCLFQHFAPRIKGFLVKTGMDPEAADDIAQNTFVAVWRKADQFDPRTTGVAAWMFTIARNQRIDAARRSTREARFARSELPVEVEISESPETIVTRGEDASRVAAALARLSDEQSTVVRLSFLENTAHSDIAHRLGIPLGTVKSRIRLAMNRLRELLDDPT